MCETILFTDILAIAALLLFFYYIEKRVTLALFFFIVGVLIFVFKFLLFNIEET